MDHPGEAVPEGIRDAAVRLAREGALEVRMLVVTSPEVRTQGGVAVGTRYAAFRRAHPGADVVRMPPLWEEPTCVAREDPLWFFFAPCGADSREGAPVRDDSRIIRIVLRRSQR
jgi:hypothetical protein